MIIESAAGELKRWLEFIDQSGRGSRKKKWGDLAIQNSAHSTVWGDFHSSYKTSFNGKVEGNIYFNFLIQVDGCTSATCSFISKMQSVSG